MVAVMFIPVVGRPYFTKIIEKHQSREIIASPTPKIASSIKLLTNARSYTTNDSPLSTTVVVITSGTLRGCKRSLYRPHTSAIAMVNVYQSSQEESGAKLHCQRKKVQYWLGIPTTGTTERMARSLTSVGTGKTPHPELGSSSSSKRRAHSTCRDTLHTVF